MDRKQVGAWALFDFANSVYPAVIQTAVFSVFYTSFVVGNETGQGTWWWGRSISISVLIVAVSAPLLGSIADRTGLRKRFMLGFTAMCLVGLCLFTLLEPGMALAGMVFYLIANVGFEGALVFYNAYLPDIAPRDKQGWVSGLGFGVGYLGSLLGLLLALQFVPDRMDLVWLSTAAFFAVFAVPTFLFLPGDERTGVGVGEAAAWGIKNFRKILGEVLAEPDLRKFLIAFFFYIDAVLTVIVMAGPFAEVEFGFGNREVIQLFMVVQVAAFVGAMALARPTDRLGPKRVLTASLIWWCLVMLGVFLVDSPTLFFGLAVVGGIGLGAVQSASRAFMSSLIPDGKEAEMFGFYAFCGKSSSMVGPALFGYVAAVSGGNQRFGVLGLLALLLVGLALLQRVPETRGGAVGA